MSCALALRVKLRLETRATRAAWATLADLAPATARAPLMARAFMVVVMMGGGSLVCSSRWFDRGRFSSLCIVCPPLPLKRSRLFQISTLLNQVPVR